MTSTEQLEREAELCREQLLGTVRELRSRLTPGQMVDRAIDYVSDGDGAEFARNLRSQVVANPLPMTLMSAGLAWLMLSGKGKPATGGTDTMMRAMHDARDAAADAAEASADAGRGVMEKASAAAGSIKSAASSTVNSVSETYEGMAERASRSAAAAADTARNIGANATATTRTVADFCRDQPLVLAGLGLAIGAALGALLPSTEAEDNIMGDVSDGIKEEAKRAASDTYDKASAVADRALDAAADEAEKQGLVPGAEPSPIPDDAATLVPEHTPEDEPDSARAKPAMSSSVKRISPESQF